MMSRNSAIDSVRCFGICAVVFGHFCALLQDWLYVFHIPLFFTLGGLLYRKNEQAYSTYVFKKFRSLMYPFYLYGFALFIYWVLFERFYRPSGQGFVWYKAFYGLLYAGNGDEYWLRFGGAIWFLPCYFMAVVTYEGLARLSKNNTVMHFVLVVLVSLCAYGFNTSILRVNLPFAVNQAASCLPWFWLGNVFSRVGLLDCLINMKSHSIMIFLGFIFFLLSIISGPPIDLYSCSLGMSYIDLYAQSIGGILLFITLGVVAKSIRFVQYVGKASLAIMCIHQPVGRIVLKVCAILTGVSHDQIVNGPWAVLICAVIVCVCSLIYWGTTMVATALRGKVGRI